MAKAVLVDLVHSNCPQYNPCLEERIQKFCSVTEKGANEEVYLLLRPLSNSSAEGEITETELLERLAGLKRTVNLLINKSTVESIYAFKQAVDKLDLTEVQVITSSQNQAILQAFQDLLFTDAYNFTYSTVLDHLDCPARDLAVTCTHLADVKQDVQNFLQRLPAVKGEIKILKSSMISEDCFSHGFTTRTGGISYISTLSSLNLFCNTRRRDPRAVVAENLRRLSLRAGFHPHSFHMVKVNHASDVWVMSKAAPESYDGIVTNQEGVVIAAPGADCMPLLFTDPVAKVIGAAHAGWKGTLMGIAMATVNAMVQEFGSKLSNVVVVIGPSVGPCCFTLDQESARKFQAIHPDCVREMESSRPYVDIRLATRVLLERGGILPEHIQDDTVTDRTNITLCTSCHTESFFSHVRDGINFGTQIGYLWIKKSN